MPLKTPPIQQKIASPSGGFAEPWLKWFNSIKRETDAGWSGDFTNGDGDTVTVQNGKITDVS